MLTCLERELIEELGVRPDIGNLLYIQQFKHDTDEYLDFFFNINNIQAFLEIDLSITSHAVQEIAEYGFKSPQEIDLLPLFLRQRNIEDDIIKGHTQVFSYL